ncbi:AraC family transcriptional regulator [Clostridium saccharoperbutylacetonicum]
MKDIKNYYYKDMPNQNFGVDIILSKIFKLGSRLEEHWHEHLQIFYFIDGEGFLGCSKKCLTVIKGNIAIINSRELHYLESLNDNLKFYIIRIDLPFLFSDQIDLCQTKYLSPLSENLIIFKNLVKNDSDVSKCINTIIKEYFKKDIGYELAVKAHIYNLVVLLLRNHVDELITEKKSTYKLDNFKRFHEVFEYIDNNYNKKICAKELSNIAHISTYYFCRIFKQITGRTATEYINEIRLKKSIELLRNGAMNITEISINCGFSDVNYFCRLFKKKYGVSPTKFVC